MSYRVSLAAALAVLALAVVLGAAHSALAQSPPPLPVLYYGEVSNGLSGGEVTAYVLDGGVATKCGTGSTLLDNGKVVYAVDVAGDGQTPGCGKAGRQVKITVNARSATQTTPWVAIGAGYVGVRFDITLGDIPRRAAVPGIERNP